MRPGEKKKKREHGYIVTGKFPVKGQIDSRTGIADFDLQCVTLFTRENRQNSECYDSFEKIGKENRAAL